MKPPLHSKDIEIADRRLNCIPAQIKELAKAQMSVAEGKIFPADLYTIAALNRTWTNFEAFIALLELRNMSALRTLARVQIDTLARYHAMWLVDEPHELATRVMSGERIDKIKDKNNKRMNDFYLVNSLSSDCEWLPEVYKNLCGYVHFSSRHISAAVEKINEDTIHFNISGDDDRYPESSWIEIRDCFSESAENLFRYINGWVKTKDIVG